MRDSEELLRLIHDAMAGAGVDYEAVYQQIGCSADTFSKPPIVVPTICRSGSGTRSRRFQVTGISVSLFVRICLYSMAVRWNTSS